MIGDILINNNRIDIMKNNMNIFKGSVIQSRTGLDTTKKLNEYCQTCTENEFRELEILSLINMIAFHNKKDVINYLYKINTYNRLHAKKIVDIISNNWNNVIKNQRKVFRNQHDFDWADECYVIGV